MVEVDFKFGTEVDDSDLVPGLEFNGGFDDSFFGFEELGEVGFFFFAEAFVFAFFTDAEFVVAGFIVLDGNRSWLHDDAGDVASPGDFSGFFIVDIDFEARSVEELEAESNDAVIEGIVMTG